MTWRYALILDPLAADADRTDLAATIREVDASAPALSIGELSTQRGDGIFESIGVIDRHPQEVEAHLARLAHSAELCDLPAPHPDQWRVAIADAAAHCPPGECVIRLVVSRGVDVGPAPTAWLTAMQAGDFGDARTDGIRVITLDRGYDIGAAARAPWLLLGAKTLSYAVNMAALREAHRRGADDVVFVSSDGYLLEGPTSTMLLRIDGVFVTPEPGAGILHGTTQLSAFAWLTEQGYATEYRAVAREEIERADGAWLLSSVRLAAPITAVDGTPIGTDAALTDRLNAYLLSPRD